MKIHYRAEKRKHLAQCVSEFVGTPAVYMRMPTYAYKAGDFTIDFEGNLLFEDNVDGEYAQKLIAFLKEKGFVPPQEGQEEGESAEAKERAEENETSQQEEPVGLDISVPIEKVNVENLNHLLLAKGELIKKALGIADASIKVKGNKVAFPWFSVAREPETNKAYMHFIECICEMSYKQKRITAKAKEVRNERYAFRCFLLRLGFIGKAYKAERKILLQNLSGSSAFKDGKRKGEEDAVSEQSDS
ncbi:virulence protein [Phascolarctobacterium faecium]|jgi:hypothetical protein|uniref:virulence protein n=1 Tax=Phascolarctobacterium faecium TaxID=33025 RepID=UPI00205B9813|nr:virulence protein [Phascolarctobacterium faecium]DAL51579.1 MAG TPA_asm: hypothetical protein [Caudoviricetes sp.]